MLIEKIPILCLSTISCYNTLYYLLSDLIGQYYYFFYKDSVFLGYISIASTYLATPFCIILLGLYGDKNGRKSVITISSFSLAISIILFGLVPTYAQIGIYSTIFITILRLIYGICEPILHLGFYICNYEISQHKQNAATKNAIILMYNILISAIAVLFILMCKAFLIHLSLQILVILFGIILLLISILILKKYNIPTQQSYNYINFSTQYREIFKKFKTKLIISTCLLAFGPTFYMLSIIYIAQLCKINNISYINSNILCISGILYTALCLFINSKIVLKINMLTLCIIGTILSLLFSFCGFYILSQNITITNILLYMFFIITAYTPTASCAETVASGFFPIQYRYSATSLCNSFALIISSCSLILAIMLEKAFQTKIAVTIITVLLSAPALISLLFYSTKNSN